MLSDDAIAVLEVRHPDGKIDYVDHLTATRLTALIVPAFRCAACETVPADCEGWERGCSDCQADESASG